jgi:hypothetical protein
MKGSMVPAPPRGPTFIPEVGAQIVQALRAGNYMETAAAFAGIEAEQVRKWVKMGVRRRTPELEQFARDVTQAVIGVEVRNVAIVSRAANGIKDAAGNEIKGPDWHAAAWFLERMFPQHWGRRDFLKVSLDQAAQLSDEELDKELRKRGLA